MRFSAIIAVGLATSVMASPMLAKKKVVYHVVTETVIVYVTAGVPEPTLVPVVAIPAAITAVAPTTTSTLTTTSTTSSATSTSTTTSATQTLEPVVPPTTEAAVPAPTSEVPVSSVDPVVVVASPPSPTIKTDFPVPTDYKSSVLYHHNVHRANNSANPLVYDDILASFATITAATCIFKHDLSPGNGGYGQNIADMGTNSADESKKDPAQIVAGVISDMWYTSELSAFPESDYGKADPDMTNFENWGHYSQVVWKDTTAVGCATWYCGSGIGTMFSDGWSGWYTVCNYRVAGNMGGAYGKNVGRPLGLPTLTV